MVKTALIYPPVSDPTSGYHSLCCLAGYARQFGFADIDIIDSNIDSWLYTTAPEQIERTMQAINERTAQLQAREHLTPVEQMELHYALKVQGVNFAEELPAALHTFRNEAAFFDYTMYTSAVETVMLWMDALSLTGFPGQFRGFSLATSGFYNIFSSLDMRDPEITGVISRPFTDYYSKELIPGISTGGYSLVGISITYVAQIPFALSMARHIRTSCPGIRMIFGGTAVSDYWKYILDKNDFYAVFDPADACIIGEGESAFVSILQALEHDTSIPASPNIALHPRHQAATDPFTPEIKYEDICSFPVPEYSKLPWEKYLSPYPFIYYSPSRGCYWNRCTFCDYGLNTDSPTSPWRQYPLDKIMEDLRTLAVTYKYIYFSVDVLSPALLLKLAAAILEEGLDIRWGAEIRLEEYWTPERCGLLQQSGCTAISVGFESGNQRILNLINKGTKVDRLQETIQMFSEAGIGVQIMGFTGFPTETIEDALSSVDFLQENTRHWTFGGLGQFVLTKGAIIAKEPERFNILGVRPFEGEDVAWRLHYSEPEDLLAASSRCGSKELTEAKASLRGGLLDRPWVGGVDTAHSMFYHDRFGNNILSVIGSANHPPANADTVMELNGHLLEGHYYLPVHKLFSKKNLDNILDSSEREGKAVNAQNITELLQQWKPDAPSYTEPQEQQLFVRRDGTLFPFPAPMIAFLRRFEHGLSLTELLQHSSQLEFHTKLWQHSISNRFLRLKQPPVMVAHGALNRGGVFS
ncbi:MULTISPECIES: radical SAM protein [unclassified Paenibacillus]|uniref:B12-binding domain-containing radical SAM protein n=1 Tax=unclassified Paenibacillus TaxID=185978 RepID=UPI0024068A48|nr:MULTISPECIES: radical SAM protein [unclassified Paenibacillus]MDF9841709.1 anaerobic magnesium-protoporphyrin IX monomethyl ester cyclase [Paenibacillus sp. PastF-2]MDF9848179.1 anaerobic magnesium-protoporphyrin IX monomethyl ester cyclase [Paenibacillus sp. PastM-2]MDF9854868.1 anaerobic magnesium-protoporphyrin IX monomethyl ester cyclase [Paenibacillus sp. PastF-1]MDH6480138.1 anaerobic magnesium-protoporphyrin IX monomethyl ester cyclase [Paenibacillus sp. PastH-2]MDH6507569.1 anaerobi